MDIISPVEQLVRDLKVDRDTWHAVALQFKAAFETQTARLRELQDICFATQAELENERTQMHRGHGSAALTENCLSHLSGSLGHSFGTATVCPTQGIGADYPWRSFRGCTNPLFNRVFEYANQKNYDSALTHLEGLLSGPLSSKARAEGLLVKSIVLRESGPEEIFNALAACSEAVKLCNRLSELESFLPQIQDQRNLLCREFRMLRQTRDAPCTANNHGALLLDETSEFRNSCDDKEPDGLRCTKYRSGFDEHRTMEGLLAQLEEKAKDNKRRTSAQLKQRAAAKARRMSVPYYWVKARSE